MAKTTKNDVLIPDLFNDTVQGAFAQQNAFMGSGLVATGAAVVNGTFPGGEDTIGSTINVPYFGSIGEFQQNLADGTPLTPVKLGQAKEQAVVTRDGLAFEVTRWAQGGKGIEGGADPYEESAEQVVAAATRAADRRIIDAAVAPGGLVKSAFNASTPRLIDYDLVADAQLMWGDELADGQATLVVHSKTKADMLKIKDSTGRPILTDAINGGLSRFMGYPVVTSDRLPLTGSTMSAVTAAGTSPPTVTLSGTPNGPVDLRIVITVGGTLGVAKFKFSTDGGNNYSAELTTAASVPLFDTAVDSMIGANGASGLTAAFAAGTYNVDNVYTAKPVLKVRSLLVQPRSLVFWYNRKAVQLATDRDILADTELGALHLYSAALRYRRRPGKTKPGVITIEHNVSPVT